MVSIIVPTFNRATTLLRALDSVLHQTFTDWELLVVDDGSTDETVPLVRRWIKQFGLEERVSLISQTQNGGVSRARNLGGRKARGEWLAFLDSDDEWLPRRLELQMPLTPNFPLIHGEEIWIRNGRRVNPMKKHQKSGGRIFTRCVDLCCISPSAVLMRLDLFAELGGFREDFPVCEDFELWLRVSARYDIGFCEIPILCKYGGHADQLSQQYRAMDYFRIKALIPHLDSTLLTANERRHVAESIIHRGQVLVKGYQKHNRLAEIPQVDNWLSVARKALTASQMDHSVADLRPRSDNNFVLNGNATVS